MSDEIESGRMYCVECMLHTDQALQNTVHTLHVSVVFETMDGRGSVSTFIRFLLQPSQAILVRMLLSLLESASLLLLSEGISLFPVNEASSDLSRDVEDGVEPDMCAVEGILGGAIHVDNAP